MIHNLLNFIVLLLLVEISFKISMDFVIKPDPDFERLSPNPAEFQKNYLYDQNFIARRTVLAHTMIALK